MTIEVVQDWIKKSNHVDTVPAEAIETALKALDFYAEFSKPVPYKQDKRKGKECYCGKCGAYVGWKMDSIYDFVDYCSDCGHRVKIV